MRTIDDELKFNKGGKSMGKTKGMLNKNTGNDVFKIAKLGTQAMVGVAMVGAVAGAVKGAFGK